MEKIKNFSLRKTIILYMLIGLLMSFAMSNLISIGAESCQRHVWSKYTERAEYIKAVEGENGRNYTANVPRIKNSTMSHNDANIIEICDWLETWPALYLSVGGCIIAVFFFYRNKIKVPLHKLEEASKMISENRLEFTLEYGKKDEMGRLCCEFERMREELAKNNRKMWAMMEEEKTLKAVVAHDIRSPLAVLQGYQEMLHEFIPKNTLSQHQELEMVDKSLEQIKRLNHFVETMRQISSIADIEPNSQSVDFQKLADKIKEITTKVESHNLRLDYYYSKENENINVDTSFVLEVAENLINNAVEYACSQVCIQLTVASNHLILDVADDGEGVKENPQQLMKAYYRSDGATGHGHYGLGLYISRTLCEKHAGNLQLRNQKHGGAEAIATFQQMN